MPLPEHLKERTRILVRKPVRESGEFVVYWMRTAVRAEENPALDAAIAAANGLRLPCFVYHALSERYPWASDRHHCFILEGARDVQRRMERREIPYFFHLERPGRRGPHLLGLASRAALVVTEDMPVDFLSGWTRRLAEESAAPVWCVDTACLAPMLLSKKAYDRAYAFRRATQERWDRRIGAAWPAIRLERAEKPARLPFEPLDLAEREIPELLALCEIDHSVPPVAGTTGGTTEGMRRWNDFRENGLRQYARLRNDPLADGVSRLSPYLHYGQVSPFRIAREAAAQGSSGSDKFLDELLTWRELAYVFCFHRPDHSSCSALPEWARRTLESRAADPRPVLHSWETLARARTGDPLWDAAQLSLLIHGELHNNVRMTWGKAIPGWIQEPAEALGLLIDLNHRFALDGRDPASYGGILWCLGQFDRPFPPERPVLGTVRPRSTETHAKRLDVEAYRGRTSRPSRANPPKVAVIGAGIAGLACARALHDQRIPVTVFERARGSGGRMSSRRGEGLSLDLGAQYFTARDRRFRQFVESWAGDGHVSDWRGRMVRLDTGKIDEAPDSRRWVGTPEMSAVTRHVGGDLEILYNRRVQRLEATDSGWRPLGEDGRGLGVFDAVALAIPAPQAAELLKDHSPEIADAAAEVAFAPCWAVALGFKESLGIDFEGAFVEGSPLSWMARNGSKPARGGSDTWVLHASPDWSAEHLEIDREEAIRQLAPLLFELGGVEPRDPAMSLAHRWSLARPAGPLGRECLYDAARGLGACGDWCLGARVESAFLSGTALAGRILAAHNKGGTAAVSSPVSAL